MSVVRRFLDKLERRLLLRSMGIDEAAADRPAPPDDPIRERLIEVKTTRQAAPAMIRIANERQLQDDGLDTLGLFLVALEQRHVVALRQQVCAHEPADARPYDQEFHLLHAASRAPPLRTHPRRDGAE